MIVQEVKAELLSIRAKVDEAIAHVDAGVNNLNEEQVEKLGELLDAIDGEAFDARIRIVRLLGRVEMAAKVTAAVNEDSGGAPSAADLAATAAEQQAAEATGNTAA